MRDFLNLDHVYNSDVVGSSSSSSLPLQTIPFSKKGKAFKKANMDRLEQIAISQFSKNINFRDYRKMYEGRLVYQDLDDTMSVTKGIAEFRKKASLPTFIKHFDITGIIVNQLAGEFDSQKDKIRVDSIDQFSQGEFFREKNAMVQQYVYEYFELELKRLLVIKGINPDESQFETEEEKQQFLQYLEAEKAKLVSPDKIEENMAKSFQTIIGEWASHTLTADTLKWDMDALDLEELVDYLLTGRYFRHYHIGDDFYRPESWKPETTFFSQDAEITYPQDGEYVGQILFLSGADILQRYGHLLSEKVQKKLYGYETKGSSKESVSLYDSMTSGFGEMHVIPDAAYYQRDLAFKMQDVFEKPMGKQYQLDESGEMESRPAWLENSHRYGHIGNRYAKYLRDDIDIREDVLQVIEAYWRGAKMIGLLTLENEITGKPYQTQVEEGLLKEFIKDNDIKQLRTVSFKEAKEKKEINTIAWFYVPQVWKGKKINAGNSNLEEDIIFDVEPLEFQIRGDSNLFDVKLPVAGLVTSGIAQKIRPYQIEYNIAMNQIRSLLEKELGMGFMMDFNFLPSQYKNEFGETTRELVEEWRENIRELGFSFYDSSMSNTGGQNPNASVIQPIDISYIPQIRNKMELAEFWKRGALEQIGITAQRVGNPNEYESVEGTKQGVQASYAQTERIYRRFNTAKRKEREQHLYVAQYCVKDNKDITVDYLDPDNGRIVKKFTDDKFWLRKINIIPINDSNQRKNLESFRMQMIQNNTMNSDLLDYANLFTSDSFVTLVNHAQQSRDRMDKQTVEQRAHEKELMDKQLQKVQQDTDDSRTFVAGESKKDRENRIRLAEINAAAKIADNNFDMKYLAEIERISDENLEEEKGVKDTQLKEREADRKDSKDEAELRLALEKLKIENEKIKAQKEKSRNDLLIATRNKN